MGKFVRGDVVILPFPFSDLSATKRRPALIIATLTGDDVILCQITSHAVADTYSVPIDDADFTTGKLQQVSNVRPNRLFTADSRIIAYSAGTLSKSKLQEVVTKIVEILRK